MTTPSGNLQSSSTVTYNQAIQYLESAGDQMATIQGQVADAASTLAVNYQGADGVAYANVMHTWSDEVSRIRATCQQMITQLSNSASLSSSTQAAAEAAVQTAAGQTLPGTISNGVYSTLTS